jgi:hypothetical protein
MNRAKINAAIQDRFGSHHRAAESIGVSEQQLRNLTGQGATRSTQGENIRLGTALAVLRGLWPALRLDDLVDAGPFKITARNATALRELKGYAAK